MEYNVLYLVKALLKKWYVIILAMALVAAAAVGLSKLSYKQAVADYQQNMQIAQSENKKVMLQSEFSYRLDDASLSFFGEYLEEISGNVYSDEKLLSVAQSTFNEKLRAVLNDKTVMAEVAEKYELGEEELAKYLNVTSVSKDAFRVSVSELNEAQAGEMRDAYLGALQKKLQNIFFSFEIEQQSNQITVTDEAVQFINAVMEEPVAPSLVKTVITASLYGSAFACIGVLVFIFMKENKRAQKKGAEDAEKETDCEAQ